MSVLLNNTMKFSLYQFNNILNEVNKIPNNKLLSNQLQFKKQCNIFKKYVLKDKLKIEIFQINNNCYISKNFITLLTLEKGCFMQLYKYIDKYLFPLPKPDLLKQNRILLNESISINYNGIINELININELKSFINKNAIYNLLNIDYKLIIDLIISNDLNNDSLKLCGSENYDLIDEYCNFIFNNFEFVIINYKSDIDKLKEEYDNKIQRLTDKIKGLEMLILEH